MLDFAELRDFVDLKLKNYSSGMMVRLAFAVMVEADADIMLIDEVLAVGDAAFAQKCMDVFREKRRRGQDDRARHPRHGHGRRRFCDRAMLIHDGELRYIGDPEEAALRYYRLNFGGRRRAGRPRRRARSPTSTRASSTRGCENAAGERVEQRRAGRADRASTSCSRRARELDAPVFGFHFLNEDGVDVFGFNRTLTLPTASRPRRPGSACGSPATIENRLVPGPLLRRLLDRAATATQGDVALHGPAAARLRRLRDRGRARAVVSVDADVEASAGGGRA